MGVPEYKWALNMLVAYTCLGMQYEMSIEPCFVVRLLFARYIFSTIFCVYVREDWS
jgi:hypothetical protein